MGNKESEIIKYSKYFSNLEKAYNDMEKPIIIVGPVDCGKQTAMKQLCIEKGKMPYIVTETAKADELFGFNDANGDYKASPLFNAYVTGQIYYIEDVKKITKNFLDVMQNIQNSKTMNFPCGKVEKGNGFRIIISTTKLPKNNEILKNDFSVAEFDYDIDLEALICLDVDFYTLLSDMRKVAKSNKLNLDITTDTFVKVVKMKNVQGIKELAILQSILSPLNKDEIVLMSKELKRMNTNSKYLLMLDSLI